MIGTRYTCRCGAKRGEANHWYAAQIASYGGAFYLYAWDRALQMGILDDKNTVHLCGHQCVANLADEWMTDLRNEA